MLLLLLLEVDDDVVMSRGRGRVKYAHTENSLEPDPFPGPKVVRTAGWTGRLFGEELLAVAAVTVAAVLPSPAANSSLVFIVCGMPTMVNDYLALLHGEIERIVVLGKKGDVGEGYGWMWMGGG